MRMLVDTKRMKREEWLTWRRKGIGGSDAAKVCGMSRWGSPIDVYLDKTDDFPPVVTEDNMAMRVGREFEDFVARLWMEETGKKCKKRNAILQHDDYDWMIANIDRWVVGENAGLEIKTATKGDEWKDGGIPPEYMMQCLHYMAVTGADRWYLACLIVGFNKHLELRVIERDEEDIKNLIEIEREFWENRVMKKVMPAPDGSSAADDAIRTLHDSVEPGKAIDLDDMVQTMKRYYEIQELLDELTTEQKQIKQEIQVRMDDAETAYIGDHRVTWKEQAGRNTIDTKRLKEEKPEIYERYVKTGKPYRVFRVS